MVYLDKFNLVFMFLDISITYPYLSTTIKVRSKQLLNSGKRKDSHNRIWLESWGSPMHR